MITGLQRELGKVKDSKTKAIVSYLAKLYKLFNDRYRQQFVKYTRMRLLHLINKSNLMTEHKEHSVVHEIWKQAAIVRVEELLKDDNFVTEFEYIVLKVIAVNSKLPCTICVRSIKNLCYIQDGPDIFLRPEFVNNTKTINK
jgi:hypothetical protein